MITLTRAIKVTLVLSLLMVLAAFMFIEPHRIDAGLNVLHGADRATFIEGGQKIAGILSGLFILVFGVSLIAPDLSGFFQSPSRRNDHERNDYEHEQK